MYNSLTSVPCILDCVLIIVIHSILSSVAVLRWCQYWILQLDMIAQGHQTINQYVIVEHDNNLLHVFY